MRKQTQKRYLATVISCLFFGSVLTGCGQSGQTIVSPDDVALIEPVGIGESYEVVERRNIYSSAVYSGKICPYTEEYSLKQNMWFDSYACLPGDEVKKGETIIYTNTESMDEQIKNMQDQINQAAEEYADYLEDNLEELAKLKWDEQAWSDVLESWAQKEPEKATVTTKPNGETVETETPEHKKWADEYQRYDTQYRNVLIRRQMLEADFDKRKELYELDRAHNETLLKRLREDRLNSTVVSQMDGVVANIRFMESGNYIEKDRPLVAVADPNRRVLKCDFVNREDVSRAEEVYAVINGKRYDVVYKPLESGEYDRLKEENDIVYATFEVMAPDEEIEIGTFAAVVVVQKSRQNVLTVPKSVVQKGEEGAFVYVLNDGERVYTPIETGIQDLLYVEVTSGLSEGDRVLADENTLKAAVKTDRTTKLSYGSVDNRLSKYGELRYTATEWIKNPIKYGTAYFGELMVGIRQQVQKGDVLFTIRVTPDNLELTRVEKRLQRAQERLAELRKATSESDKAGLRTIEAQEESIAEMEKQIREMKADFATTEVKAPYDGVIVNMSYELWWNLKEGALLANDLNLILLAPMESKYIVVGDEGDQLMIGDQVTVDYTAVDGSTRSTEAEVVSLNRSAVSKDLLTTNTDYNAYRGGAQDSRFAILKLPPEVLGDVADSIQNVNGYWSTPTFKISVVTRRMDNVLLIPKGAVVASGGVTYAKVLREDGSVVNQGFVAGGADTVNYWVAEGLTEGMEVCIE